MQQMRGKIKNHATSYINRAQIIFLSLIILGFFAVREVIKWRQS